MCAVDGGVAPTGSAKRRLDGEDGRCHVWKSARTRAGTESGAREHRVGEAPEGERGKSVGSSGGRLRVQTLTHLPCPSALYSDRLSLPIPLVFPPLPRPARSSSPPSPTPPSSPPPPPDWPAMVITRPRTFRDVALVLLGAGAMHFATSFLGPFSEHSIIVNTRVSVYYYSFPLCTSEGSRHVRGRGMNRAGAWMRRGGAGGGERGGRERNALIGFVGPLFCQGGERASQATLSAVSS